MALICGGKAPVLRHLPTPLSLHLTAVRGLYRYRSVPAAPLFVLLAAVGSRSAHPRTWRLSVAQLGWVRLTHALGGACCCSSLSHSHTHHDLMFSSRRTPPYRASRRSKTGMRADPNSQVTVTGSWPRNRGALTTERRDGVARSPFVACRRGCPETIFGRPSNIRG